MKHIKNSIALATLMFTSVSYAEFNANVGVTSNYMWRGVTQSSDGAAVSGGLDYANESGFYAGLWASNIDFGTGSGTEIDYYAGFGGEMGNIGYDVGLSMYTYPDDGFEDSNFTEAYVNLSIQDFTVGLATTINSDIDDDQPFGTGDIHFHGAYTFSLPAEYSLSATLGHYAFDVDENIVTDVDYSYLQLDLSKDEFTFSFSKATENSGDDGLKVYVSWAKAW